MAAPMGNVRYLLTTLKTTVNLSCRLLHCHKVGQVCPGHGQSQHLSQPPRYLCSKRTGESAEGGQGAASQGDKTDLQETKPKLTVQLARPKERRKLVAKEENEAEKSSSSDSQSSSDSSDSDSSDEETDINPEMRSAAKGVATALGGDVRQTESELLSQLLKHESLTQSQKEGQLPPRGGNTISEVVSGMKVQHDAKKGAVSREKTGRGIKSQDEGLGSIIDQMKGPPRKAGQYRRSARVIDIKLYEGSALGIFSEKSASKEVAEVKSPNLFSLIEREQMEKSCTFPPPNAFEEMIQWTEQGKIWKFPIDNEYGLDEEAQVGFHEHVFLDHLLAHFPERGPVRLFMELVIVGLSKNPYLTVQQKHEHVMWFKDYFDKKRHILEELMATGDEKSQKELQERIDVIDS